MHADAAADSAGFNHARSSSGSNQGGVYSSDDIALLRSLPIYRTTAGTFTSIDPEVHCLAAPVPFMALKDERCLDIEQAGRGGAEGGVDHSAASAAAAAAFLAALGVPTLDDAQVLAKFGLPSFSGQPGDVQEEMLSFVQVGGWVTQMKLPGRCR